MYYLTTTTITTTTTGFYITTTITSLHTHLFSLTSHLCGIYNKMCVCNNVFSGRNDLQLYVLFYVTIFFACVSWTGSCSYPLVLFQSWWVLWDWIIYERGTECLFERIRPHGRSILPWCELLIIPEKLSFSCTWTATCLVYFTFLFYSFIYYSLVSGVCSKSPLLLPL